MKKYLLIIIFSLLLMSCQSKIETNTFTIDTSSTQKEYKSASTLIYSNDSCLDWKAETLPIIKLKSDTILAHHNVEGILFFSSNYLRELAKCNHLSYRISFDVLNLNRTRYRHIIELHRDTITLSLPYDSLKLVNSTKNIDEYLLDGTLKAAFYKENVVWEYDTMMHVVKKIFVLNNNR